MPNLGFMAVQCVQCSTMQVKQQKRSSNKWICAVCNQKQSVTRVFARGPQAKDLRLFVQGFNMSRGSALESRAGEQRHAVPEDSEEEEMRDRKRRTDWSEYLDPTATATAAAAAAMGGGEEEDKDGELDFVTEMPKEKRSEKSFPKRPPRGANERERTNVALKKVKKTTTTTKSKWDEYLEEEMHNVLDAEGLWGNDGKEEEQQLLRDVRVEEEVHLDFI